MNKQYQYELHNPSYSGHAIHNEITIASNIAFLFPPVRLLYQSLLISRILMLNICRFFRTLSLKVVGERIAISFCASMQIFSMSFHLMSSPFSFLRDSFGYASVTIFLCRKWFRNQSFIGGATESACVCSYIWSFSLFNNFLLDCT